MDSITSYTISEIAERYSPQAKVPKSDFSLPFKGDKGLPCANDRECVELSGSVSLDPETWGFVDQIDEILLEECYHSNQSDNSQFRYLAD